MTPLLMVLAGAGTASVLVTLAVSLLRVGKWFWDKTLGPITFMAFVFYVCTVLLIGRFWEDRLYSEYALSGALLYWIMRYMCEPRSDQKITS